MCGRFVLEHTPEQIRETYRLSSSPGLSQRFNIAPSQPVAVVRQHNDGDRELVFLQWGLIPSWAKDAAIGYKMINARSETAHEKPSFRQAFLARRCVIPASGFYEWEKSGKQKIPHYIHLRDGKLMSLAGLWEKWKSPDGKTLETCAILTTTANSLVKQLHERMPVILHSDELDPWLSHDIDQIDHLQRLFHPYPASQLEEYPVTTAVNSPAYDDPACILATLQNP